MPTHAPTDSNDLLAIALAFLQQHLDTHRGCDQALFSRAAAHLRLDYGVEAEQAHVIAGRAYGKLRAGSSRYQLDLAGSSASLAMLTDSASGLTYMVPVATIARLILDAPTRRHLRAVT